jgi:exportin-7
VPQQSAGQADERLEWALLFFIGQFRRMYIGEQSLPSSKLYKSLSHLMGLNDHVMVMNLVITKMYVLILCDTKFLLVILLPSLLFELQML